MNPRRFDAMIRLLLLLAAAIALTVSPESRAHPPPGASPVLHAHQGPSSRGAFHFWRAA
jgi:hypothetical protein